MWNCADVCDKTGILPMGVMRHLHWDKGGRIILKCAWIPSGCTPKGQVHLRPFGANCKRKKMRFLFILAWAFESSSLATMKQGPMLTHWRCWNLWWGHVNLLISTRNKRPRVTFPRVLLLFSKDVRMEK